MIRINIQRTEPNPDYEADKKAWEEGNKYNRNFPENMPSATRVTDVLSSEITEEQFAAIRRGILEKF